MTTQVSPKREVAYLSELLQQRQNLEARETVAWLQDVRDRATPVVSELAIPTTRDEEWRFTDLSALLKVNFVAAKPTSALPDISSFVLPEAAESRLVFVDGFYAPELSSVAGMPEGVFVGNLQGSKIDALRDYLAKLPGGQEVFTALNTASLTDAAMVWIPKDRAVEVPIHLLFVTTAGESPTVAHPRCLVVAESGSAVTVVEEYVVCPHPQPLSHGRGGQEYSAYLTNAVTEVWVGENAQVTHTRMQREGEEAFHVGKTAIAQARHSRYTCCAVSLGAKLSRHNLEIFQTGEGTETILNALTKIASEQRADTHSTIALNHPYGTARQVHKCIVGDRARAVFNGKILVPKPAQLTDAGQLSRTLLLSPKARVDTKPQLEITADNVKCAHGATVSQLETDEIFYLQSRGLDADSARNLLINAFATEIVDRIPLASLRQTISQIVRSNPIS
jgi:Fe-S cluster assembly protein SufD